MALSQEQILELRTKYKIGATATATKPGFFTETGEDIVQTGQAVAGTLKETFGQGGTVSKALGAGIEGEQGLLRSLGQSFGAGAAGVTRGIGNLFTGAIKTILPQGAETAIKEKVESTATPVVQSALSIPAVKNFIKDYQSLDEKSKRDVDALFGIGSLAAELATSGAGSPIKKAGQEILETGVKGVVRTGEALSGAVKSGVGAVAPVVKGVRNVTGMIADEASRIPYRISTNVAEKQAVRETIKQLPSKVAKQAAQDGVAVADVRTILKVPKSQKGPVKKLVKSVQDFASGVSKKRPEEVVGRPMSQAIKRLDTQAQKVGKKIGEVSKKLGVVTKEELVDPVFSELKKISGLSGLEMKNGVLNFKNTVLTTTETASDRKAIQSIFKQATKWGKGDAKHRLRQELFEVLGGKKKSLKALTDTQEKAYEAIRKGLANVLDKKDSTYKALNQQYAKTAGPLRDLRKMLKLTDADDDIVDMASGLLARRLTSNAPSNPQLRNILRSMDNALKTKGKSLVNIENLQDVYNVLDKYYDIAAKTGFQGQTKAGVEKAVGVGELIVGKTRELAGETSAVRQKALEKLLAEILK